MKMKDFGPRGGHASLAPPLDPPLFSEIPSGETSCVCEATTLTTEVLRNVLMIFELTPIKAPNDLYELT